MGHKKTNEAWFGDSFNRPYNLAFSTADGNTYTAAVNSMSVEHALDGTCSITADLGCGIDGTAFTVAKGVNSYAESFSVKSDVDAITTQLKELQAQLHELKQNFVPKNNGMKLRSELKTLTYNREI